MANRGPSVLALAARFQDGSANNAIGSFRPDTGSDAALAREIAGRDDKVDAFTVKADGKDFEQTLAAQLDIHGGDLDKALAATNKILNPETQEQPRAQAITHQFDEQRYNQALAQAIADGQDFDNALAAVNQRFGL